MEKKGKFSGLIPFIVFVVIYLGTGIVLELKNVEMAFYQLPSPVAIFVGIILAFILFKGNMEEKFEEFVKGCGDQDIIIMCTIYLLAGAFATVSGAMGGVESTVNLGLTFIPAQYIAAGLFLIAAFISLATGTSCGAVVALCPIAFGFAEKTGVSLGLIMGSVIGGAMFGDNLSVISDTTIAATRTQGVEMRDKFRVNMTLALPSAVLTFILLIFIGKPEVVVATQAYDYNVIKVLPYLFVLGLSLFGINVFVTLSAGILLSGIVGLIYGDLTLLKLSQEIFKGFGSMNEIFLLSMLTGGLAALSKKAGGIDWLVEKIQKIMRGKRSALLGIGLLCGITDMSIANNTVSIIINGPIARDISRKFRIDPRKTATILDVFACIFQGMIPYGAQMLIVMGFTKGQITWFDVVPFLYYQAILLVITIVSIYTPIADYYINKNPWDWDDEKVVEER